MNPSPCQLLQTQLNTLLPHERDLHFLDTARAHAATCPSCAADLTLLLSLEQSLSTLPAIPPSPNLLPDIMRTVHPAVSTPLPFARIASLSLGILSLTAIPLLSPIPAKLFSLHLYPTAGPIPALLSLPLPLLSLASLGTLLILTPLLSYPPPPPHQQIPIPIQC